MVEIESDQESAQESIESGSCDCSDYNQDVSWFYDSRNLQTSFMRFCIIKDDEQEQEENITKKEQPKNANDDQKNNEPKNVSNIYQINRGNNVIKFSKSSRKTEPNNDENKNKTKLTKNYNNNVIKYHIQTKNNDKLNNTDNNTDNNDDNNQNKVKNYTYKPKKNYVKRHNNSMFNNVYNVYNTDSKQTNLLSDNKKEYEPINNEPERKIEIDDEKITSTPIRSPVNQQKRQIKFYNNYKTDKKFEDTIRKLKGYVGPRMCEIDDDNDEIKIVGNYDSNDTKNTTRRNNQTRGRTVKERVVKEVKNITLQPGQTIKHRTITKRKLKPITTIVNNDDGTQNIVTESTTLTTITINENLDSSKMYDDEYPLDVQLVKQYITKVYKTEIEVNTYKPKK